MQGTYHRRDGSALLLVPAAIGRSRVPDGMENFDQEPEEDVLGWVLWIGSAPPFSGVLAQRSCHLFAVEHHS